MPFTIDRTKLASQIVELLDMAGAKIHECNVRLDVRNPYQTIAAPGAKPVKPVPLGSKDLVEVQVSLLLEKPGK